MCFVCGISQFSRLHLNEQWVVQRLALAEEEEEEHERMVAAKTALDAEREAAEMALLDTRSDLQSWPEHITGSAAIDDFGRLLTGDAEERAMMCYGRK